MSKNLELLYFSHGGLLFIQPSFFQMLHDDPCMSYQPNYYYSSSIYQYLTLPYLLIAMRPVLQPPDSASHGKTMPHASPLPDLTSDKPPTLQASIERHACNACVRTTEPQTVPPAATPNSAITLPFAPPIHPYFHYPHQLTLSQFKERDTTGDSYPLSRPCHHDPCQQSIESPCSTSNT